MAEEEFILKSPPELFEEIRLRLRTPPRPPLPPKLPKPDLKTPDQFIRDMKKQMVSPVEIGKELHEKFIDDTVRIKTNLEKFPTDLTESLVSGGHDIIIGLTNMPLDFVEDTSSALLEITGKPVDILETVVRTPAHLIKNLPDIVDIALKESVEMRTGSYEDKATRARTVTDFIPFI